MQEEIPEQGHSDPSATGPTRTIASAAAVGLGREDYGHPGGVEERVGRLAQTTPEDPRVAGPDVPAVKPVAAQDRTRGEQLHSAKADGHHHQTGGELGGEAQAHRSDKRCRAETNSIDVSRGVSRPVVRITANCRMWLTSVRWASHT